MNIIILIFALIGSFIIVKKLSINTYNMIKYKFDVQKLIDNKKIVFDNEVELGG